jgi:hypothetical protein
MFSKTTDYGKTWTPLVSPEESRGVRGYAHVIKEDLIKPNLLFLGTEFGLYVSIDGGKNWAQFKVITFRLWPSAISQFNRAKTILFWQRTVAGYGLWMTSRRCAPDTRSFGAGSHFVSARPVQQRIEGGGGWANGDAVFVGDNPPDAAVITYYQRSRHLFGKLKLEVLDSSGRVIDELPASKRPGLNRVTWTMREKPPRVPPAAQIAFAGTRGPRLVPRCTPCD